MRIVFFGAGAVGGYFGAKLAYAGNDVALVARGKHLEAILKNGLEIRSVDGDFTVHPQASADPAELGEADLVVLAVKSQDTPAALQQMRPIIGPETSILTLQNGVENEEMIAAAYGEERVLGGVAYIGSRLESLGVIVHRSLGRITLGRWPSGDDEDTREITALFEAAGIPTKQADDIRAAKWRKLVWNASFNPVSVLIRTDSATLATDPHVKQVVASIMNEVIAVAAAFGIHIDPSIVERSIEMTTGSAGVNTSMLQDFEKGKPLELDALLGVVVRKGRELDVPVPVSSAVYSMVEYMGRNR